MGRSASSPNIASNPTPHAIAPQKPPIAPSHVLFGLMFGASLREPTALPTKYAAVSVANVTASRKTIQERPSGYQKSSDLKTCPTSIGTSGDGPALTAIQSSNLSGIAWNSVPPTTPMTQQVARKRPGKPLTLWATSVVVALTSASVAIMPVRFSAPSNNVGPYKKK